MQFCLMRSMLVAVGPLALWSMVWGCCSANAAASPSATEAITSCMLRAAAELEFNGSIYVHLDNESLERSFGTSDAAGKFPIGSQTPFNIASAGKMFTAVAIGKLVDRGLIAFDASIRRYLGGLETEIGAITVDELLNHTSGLGNYFNPHNGAAIQNARSATDLLPLALAEHLAFPPGSKRAYSNSGFVVLGAIIEKVTGESYADFIRTEILLPLNMKHTAFDAQNGAVPMSRISPDGTLASATPVPTVFLRSSPAGGIYSTAEDVAVFMAALKAGRLVTKGTLAQLFSPRPDPGGGDTVYGYGFNVRAELPSRVGHGGGAPGISAEIALYPESGRQIISLSNHDPPTATRMVTVLERAIFAAEPSAACNEALADPALRPPALRSNTAKTLAFRFERTIAAPPGEASSFRTPTAGRGYEKGSNYFPGIFPEQFAKP